MTEEEKELMNRYGITVEQKSVYSYKGYKYEHLKVSDQIKASCAPG
jgi:hypothetical protein